MDAGDRPARIANVVGERVVAPGIDDVHEPVGNPRALLGGRLAGRRVEAPIDLEGVAGDDLAADPLGDGDRQTGFAGSGGSGQDEEGWIEGGAGGLVLGLGRLLVASRVRSRYAFTASCMWSRQ